jgi:hypothetical protein
MYALPEPSTTNHLYTSHYRCVWCARDLYSAARGQTLSDAQTVGHHKDTEYIRLHPWNKIPGLLR